MNYFCRVVDQQKVNPYFQSGASSAFLIIVRLWHHANKICLCVEPKFGHGWLNLCSSYATLLLTNTTVLPLCILIVIYWCLLVIVDRKKCGKLRFLSHINLTKISLALSPILFVHWKFNLQKQLFTFVLENSLPENLEKLLAKYLWWRLVIVKLMVTLRKWVKNLTHNQNLKLTTSSSAY